MAANHITAPDRHADAVTSQLDNALVDLVDLTAERHNLSHITRVALCERLKGLALSAIRFASSALTVQCATY